MKPDFAAALGQFSTAVTPASVAGKSAKAARDFESVLLTSLFDSLQKSFAFDSQDSTPGSSDYRLMGTRALAEAVAASGGIGIARLILRHLPVTKVSQGS
jgi:Rod binding domain-containing protein